MAKGKHRGLKAILIVLGAIIGLFLALQIILNSRIVDKVVDKFATQFVDGTVDYSDIKVSLWRFPSVRLRIDSLSLTYPHDRFAAWDSLGAPSRMREAGRAEAADTLASLGRLSVALNPFPLISGNIKVKHVGLSGLRAFAHSYNDSTANWNMFLVGSSEKDTTSSGIPDISLGSLRIQRPVVYYTDQADTLYAMARMQALRIGGQVSSPEEGALRLRRIRLDMDSLFVRGRLPADTLSAGVEYLDINEHGTQLFDVQLGARALARTGSYGRLELPLEIDSRLGFSMFPGVTSIDIQKLLANVAHIPMSAQGKLDMMPDSLFVDATMKVDNCPIDTLLADYARAFTPIADDIITNARLDVDASATGCLTSNQVPAVKACVRIPDGHIYYRPLDLGATLNVDIDASLSPNRRLDADIEDFFARTRGLKLSLDGSAYDLLGGDPRIKAVANGFAKLDSLTRMLPEGSGIEAGGDVNIDLMADAYLSEFNQYKFQNASLSGKVSAEKIAFRMPADTLGVLAYNTLIDISSSQRGIELEADLDSARVAIGADMRARVRGMKNTGYMHKVETRSGKMAPKLELTSDNASLFLKTGATRIMARGATVSASITKRLMPDKNAQQQMLMKRRLDSLRRSTPGLTRIDMEDLMSGKRSSGAPGSRSYTREKDFAKADISIALDSSLTDYLKQWKPDARISIRRGSIMTPALPLRTRLRGLYGSFDGDKLSLDTLSVKCGTSDVVASGSLSGLRRSLVSKGNLKADLDIRSRRININEIIAALQIAQQNKIDTTALSEEDESFVIDTLGDVVLDSTSMKLVVVPGNVDASLRVKADTINYTDILITPGVATVNMRDRVLQLTDTEFSTNLGDIALDAFYSTQTKKDISAGADLKLKNVSAEGIIHMLPTVDQMMPALKSFKGKLGCNVTATTQLDTNMNILMPSVDGVIRIEGKNLRVDDAGDLKKITRLLVFKDKNIGDIDDLYVNAVVHDNKLEVYPFILSVDRYMLALYGVQGFDKTMNYQVSILKSPFLIKFGVRLYGKLDDWHFGLTRAKYRNGDVPAFSQELDSLQLNLGTSIRNIYRQGIDGVRRYNRNSIQSLEQRKAERHFDPNVAEEALSEEETRKFEAEVKEQEEKQNEEH